MKKTIQTTMTIMAMVVGMSTFANDNSYVLDINQYGVLKSVKNSTGFILKCGELKKRPANAYKKYGWWWASQGNKTFDSEPGYKEEQKNGERIISRQGFMGDNEYKIKYSEKIIFTQKNILKFSYTAIFEKKSEWTYPLFVCFSLSPELVAGRGYLITTLEGTKEMGLVLLESSDEKEETTIRKIKNIAFSTTKGVVKFYGSVDTETWVIFKKGSASIQIVAANFTLLQNQIIEKGSKKTLNFSIQLPELKAIK